MEIKPTTSKNVCKPKLKDDLTDRLPNITSIKRMAQCKKAMIKTNKVSHNLADYKLYKIKN